MSSFRYSPLNPTDIRIVVIEKGKMSDPIKCRLIHARLSVATLYDALSYEWGPPQDREPTILLNGYNFRVRKNLYDALLHIRLEKSDRHIWIDQLSINQPDKRERGHQVARMGEIYETAQQVVAWIGLSNDSRRVAMERLAKGPVARSQKSYIAHYTKHVRDLFQCSYWGRAWIWQELYLAQRLTLQCGSQAVSGRAFQNSALQDIGWGIFTGLQAPALMVITMKATGDKHVKSLYQWIDIALDLKVQCTEPRDLIYAMFGMAGDRPGARIIPDYQKPLREVFLETVEFCRPSSVDGTRVYADTTFGRKLAQRLNLRL